MSNLSSKTSSNVFYLARSEASKYNEPLRSREGVAMVTGIDRSRIVRIESGVATPHPEEVHLLADLYNAPELENYYCKHVCPLGNDIPEPTVSNLDRVVIEVVSTLRGVADIKDKILDIAADGVITDNERPDMERVLKNLEEVERVTEDIKLWAKKNL